MATLDEKITRVENNVAASLEAAAEMGAEVPEGANSNNLPNLIRSIPRGGASSWKDLPDKPVVLEGTPDTVTWDGNTEGRATFTVNTNIVFYKVSDAVPKFDELPASVNIKYRDIYGDSSWDGMSVTQRYAGVVGNASGWVWFVDQEGVGHTFANGDTIPEPGTYFMVNPIEDGYTVVTSLTIPGYTGFATEKFDPAYLPDSVVQTDPEQAPNEGDVLTHQGGKPVWAAPTGGNGGGSTEDCLKYTAQTLTDEQKVQARTNIGAADKTAETDAFSAALAAVAASPGAVTVSFFEFYEKMMTYGIPVVHVSDKVPTMSDLEKGFCLVIGTDPVIPDENLLVATGYVGAAVEVPPKTLGGEELYSQVVAPLNAEGTALLVNSSVIIAAQDMDLEGLPIRKGVSFIAIGGVPLAFRINGYNLTGNDEAGKSYSPTLTWDGNTAGRTVMDLGDDAKLVHVSDSTPTLNDLQAGYTLKVTDGTNVTVINSIEADLSASEITAGLISLYGEALIVALSDGITVGTVEFPKKGVYFFKAGTEYISELTINGYQFEVEGSKATAAELTWDGVTTGPDDIIQYIGDTDHTKIIAHYVSSSTPTEADLQKGFEFKVFDGSEMKTATCSANDAETYADIVTVDADIGSIHFGMSIAIFPKDIEQNNVTYKKGIYFLGTGNIYTASLKINGYTFVLPGEPEIIGLPAYTAADEGKVLKIVNGVPTWVAP